MRSISITTFVVITAFFALVGPLSQAHGSEPLKGNVAVMALVAEREDPAATARMAKSLHEKLKDRVDLLPVEQIVQRFGGIGKPDQELERVRGWFQMGYLHWHNLEHNDAVKSMKRVLTGLERVADGPGRWELFVRANIYLGKAFMNNNQPKAAVRAFQQVLRTRPDLAIYVARYPPNDIKSVGLWKAARRKLATLPSGTLTVDADRAESKIFLDGVQVGQVPYTGVFPHGRYHLRVENPLTGSVSSWVHIGDKPVIKRYQMEFETAIDTRLDHPAMRIPKRYKTLPTHWWPWLGVRLGVKRLVVVTNPILDKRSLWSASLVDAETGRIVRQGWLEPSGPDVEHMDADAGDLASFLITGKENKRVIVVQQHTREQSAIRAKPGATSVSEHASEARPLLRTWWPYAAVGAGLIAGGVVSHIAYSNQDTDVEEDRQRAKLFQGTTIAGYALGAGVIALGAILHHTYPETREEQKIAFLPFALDTGGGIQVVGRF